MTDRVLVRRGSYLDSVSLMLASQDAASVPGVEHASAVNATPLNVELLERQGFDLDSHDSLGPNDLVLAIRAGDDSSAQAAVDAIEDRLRSSAGSDGGESAREAPRSISAAARARPELNLAVISVPGQHATYECARALDAGLHVFCFSDGVPLEDELALKRRALELGLLMMGPDCGTAVIDGVGLGFANVLDRGPVGIVGASGTGIQALSSMLDAAGIGVSQAIGVGGRDLSSHIGGLMTLRGIELLAADPGTEMVVVISKAPDGLVARRVADAARAGGKPFVLAFPGLAPGDAEALGAELSLEGAATRAAELAGGVLPEPTESLAGPATP
jgi:FdrA protein